jgi:uncharacterized protein YbjT (DUF2867 family)
MKFVVFGATGMVGSHVTRELLARGHQVRAVTRDLAKARHFGAGVEVVKADLLDPDSLPSVFEGIDGVFLISMVSPTESHETLIGVTAARAAKVKRIVYLSVQHADRGAYLPHFGSKVGVEIALKNSGIPYTVLRPSNFHQNDVWFRDVMLQHGVYPQPLGGVGVSRVDVRDIGEAAAIVLTQGGHDGKTYDLVGPRAVTGPECTKIWSAALGRELAYGGDDMDAWEKQARTYLPLAMAFDFRHMYAHFQEKGLVATADEVAALTRLLGHAPRPLEAYAAETAKAWSAEGVVSGAKG